MTCREEELTKVLQAIECLKVEIRAVLQQMQNNILEHGDKNWMATSMQISIPQETIDRIASTTLVMAMCDAVQSAGYIGRDSLAALSSFHFNYEPVLDEQGRTVVHVQNPCETDQVQLPVVTTVIIDGGGTETVATCTPCNTYSESVSCCA